MAPLHASLGLTTWTLEPTVLLGLLALSAGYVWVVRSGGRHASWSPLARVYFAAGLFVMFVALASPIDTGGDRYLFSLHMLQHLLLAMVVPPLLLLGLPESWRALDRIHVSPLVANVGFNAVLAVWHLPFLYEATLRNQSVHVFEHLSFLAAGVLFWWPIMVPAGRRLAMSVIGKIAYLGFAGVPPTILGLAFILSPVVIYPFYAAAPRVTPLSPLDDQLIAGLVMFGLGNLIYFAAIWIIFFRLDDKEATAGERPAVEIETPVRMGR
ncbi:MAG TPA: cytochrome c oxidase assembly protein [Candidatus Dormibacteraeota bacterium]|nr:cytochrome c oxidase assembly protein [Candidatus Dormibacteraeota bacterium]